MINVNIFCLADQGQVVNGKLYLLGAGWKVIAAPPSKPISYCIGLALEVPWAETGQEHTLELTLTDAAGKPVHGPNGEPAIIINGKANVIRPPGVLLGEPVPMSVALPVPPMVLAPGKYSWHLVLDGAAHLDWELPFTIAAGVALPLAS